MKESHALTAKVNIARTMGACARDFRHKCALKKVYDDLWDERARVDYRHRQVDRELSASCACGTTLSQRKRLPSYCRALERWPPGPS